MNSTLKTLPDHNGFFVPATPGGHPSGRRRRDVKNFPREFLGGSADDGHGTPSNLGYGGRYVAETLMPLIGEIEAAYDEARLDPAFQARLEELQRDYVGRATPLYFAERLTEHFGGARIYLKREDLNHTGAHKINNALGQALLAQRMGRQRLIAETGAGMHGVAVATIAARLGLGCVIYMGATDIERQQPNVQRMRLLGAEIVPVHSGTATLKDAMNEALRDWVANVDDTFYIIGTVAGPAPYPRMVRDFQTVIGLETREQLLTAQGRLPDTLVACVGGGSNAMGLFHAFLDDAAVAMVGVEAAGEGLESGRHAASLNGGAPGILHGNRTYLLQDDDGQIRDAHSISAGLDYPGIGPEHAYLHDSGRASYVAVTDEEALEAVALCCRLEGILPALESAHALHHAGRLAARQEADQIIVVCLSGRGDKDMDTITRHLMPEEAES
ncbi:tryptophan synthase subunit beta [Salinicola sp. CR57]|uniref:tryptophan synthase subunit beta n=1 Tax=Salinicola sp. CR57 TaxID=1949086 RepID=UPI000DA1959E|nr:tryptophan synthase subunit beta [Salinicola sp. CR57]